LLFRQAVLFQSLKTKLTFNFAFFLLIAILLTDFVVIRIVEKRLIQDRIEKGGQFIAEIAGDFFENPIKRQPRNTAAIDRLVGASKPWVAYALVTVKKREIVKYGTLPDDISMDMEKIKKCAGPAEGSQYALLGKTWGVFWKQNKYVALSEPYLKSQPAGAATVVIRLDDIYSNLRESQKIIIFYCLANLFVLLFISMLRLSRLVVRPIHRFIRLTEDVHSTDQFPDYPGKRNTEFNQLSNAIHQMARRIEADKERIEESLHSLEKAHADLKKTQKEMIRAEKLASIGRLSAGIAHEIGNPIGVVLGYLGLLKKQPAFTAEARGREYIERAESEINRINTIIRQLLDFSRSSSSDRQVVFVHALIKDVGQMISSQPLMEKVKLVYDYSASDERIYADYQQLRQVLINLLINAVDSIAVSNNSETGEILLRTRDIPASDENAVNQSATVELTVTDNGTGIAREEIDNIFDPFYTTKEPGKGTGLGLSVSYMIIEQIGGTINVKSELEQGTAISIYLPVAARS